MNLFSILSLLALLFAGCVAPVKQSVPFDDSAFAWAAGKGTATIAGSAFLKTRGGDVKVGAGNNVELIPVTPYTIERFRTSVNLPLEARDPRLSKHIRTTLADAQGNFEFKEIPPGDYFLACIIQWQYGTGLGTATTGGQAIALVSVKSDEVKKVVLTK